LTESSRSSIRRMLHDALRYMQTKPAISMYARPEGSYVHTDINCLLLIGDGQLRYKEISLDEARRRKLVPCVCMVKRLDKGSEDERRVYRL